MHGPHLGSAYDGREVAERFGLREVSGRSDGAHAQAIPWWEERTLIGVRVVALAGAAASAVVYGLGSLGRGGATPVKLSLAGAAMAALLSSLTSAVLIADASALDRCLHPSRVLPRHAGGLTGVDQILLHPLAQRLLPRSGAARRPAWSSRARCRAPYATGAPFVPVGSFRDANLAIGG